MPITKELKERWLERLESPDAKWASGVLHNKRTGGMCCLGHLADITNAWDDIDKSTVDGSLELPESGFWGLTCSEMTWLATANDDGGCFPLTSIRDLPEAEAA